MKNYFTVDDILNADIYATYHVNELKLSIYTKLYPHIFAFCYELDDTNTETITHVNVPEQFKFAFKEVKYGFNQKGCDNLSCYPYYPKSKKCKFDDSVRWYASGDNKFLSCQPACFNLLYNKNDVVNRFDLSFKNNKCVKHDTGLQMFATDPSTRSSKAEPGLTNLPTGFNYDRITGSVELNKYYCEFFLSNFDETKKDCNTSIGMDIKDFLVGATIANLITSHSSVPLTPPAITVPVGDQYQSAEKWKSQRPKDFFVREKECDDLIDRYNNITADDLKRPILISNPIVTATTAAQGRIKRSLYKDKSNVDKFTSFFVNMYNNPIVEMILQALAYEVTESQMRRLIKITMPKILESVTRTLMPFIIKRSTLAFTHTVLLTAAKVGLKVLGVTLRTLAVLVDPVFWALDMVGILGFVLDYIDELGLNYTFTKETLDKYVKALRDEHTSNLFKEDVVTAGEVWNWIERHNQLPDEYQNVLIFCHFYRTMEYFEQLDYNSYGQKIDHKNYTSDLDADAHDNNSKDLNHVLKLMAVDDFNAELNRMHDKRIERVADKIRNTYIIPKSIFIFSAVFICAYFSLAKNSINSLIILFLMLLIVFRFTYNYFAQIITPIEDNIFN
jgi:Baculoviridae P74 N-terminal/Baculoviridae p74 conserved region